MSQAIELYENHSLLLSHLQEFYANMTSIYHSSPKAQRVAMMIRLRALDYYGEPEPHTRVAHAIGALFLADVMSKPDDWPSVHFPPNVPDQKIDWMSVRSSV